MVTSLKSLALDRFSPVARAWFSDSFAGADARAGTGLGGDRLRRAHAAARAHGLGQDAGGVPLVPRPAGERAIDERTVPRPAGRRKRAGVRVLYVSPLKALSYDVERNLRAPLAGLRIAAAREGIEPPDITVATRTGDTPQTRARRHPPRPAGHPDHDAGVALPDAHVAIAGNPALGRHRHRRRDPHDGRRPSAARTSRSRSNGSKRLPGAKCSASGSRRRSGRWRRSRSTSAATAPCASPTRVARRSSTSSIVVPVEDMARPGESAIVPRRDARRPRHRSPHLDLAGDLPAAARRW